MNSFNGIIARGTFVLTQLHCTVIILQLSTFSFSLQAKELFSKKTEVISSAASGSGNLFSRHEIFISFFFFFFQSCK